MDDSPDTKERQRYQKLLDIPVSVSVELGRARLLVGELTQMGQGAVVELNKVAGEPMEVFVNGKLVARGESVVINGSYGVRLIEILNPQERVRQLGMNGLLP